jgi:hypothetical protein
MFDTITLRRSDAGSQLTPGELAEALLFYQNIHLVIDQPAFRQLGKTIGIPTLLELLSRSNISVTYCDHLTATMTRNLGGVQYHDLGTGSLVDKDAPHERSVTAKLAYIMRYDLGHSTKDSKKYATLFRTHVPVRSFASNDFLDGGILNAARDDRLDQGFVSNCVRNILSVMVGEKPLPPLNRFNILKMQDGFVVDTDLDFASLHRHGHEDITPAFILDIILTARADLALAAHYGGDLHTWQLTSEIVRLRHAELLRRIGFEKSSAC